MRNHNFFLTLDIELFIMKMVRVMKKYLKYGVIFLFFLILFFLSPISGDDWGNYLVGSSGLRHSLGVALGMYFDWEGRLVSRIFINILTYHKWLWNIINALLIVVFIYGAEKLIEKKKKYVFPLVVLLILGMNPYMFSQVMVWLAGNMTYFFIVPVLLVYFYYLINNDKYNKWFVVIFSLINFFGTMFVENMALVLVFGNILVLIYKYIKTKKLDKRVLLYLGLAIIGTIIMLLSPGTRYRSSIENVEFNQLSLIGKIVRNIPNFIYYTFIGNTYLLGLMSLSNYLLIRKHIKNKWLKYGLIVYMLVGALLTMAVYPLSLVRVSSLEIFINNSNILVILYWLIYLIITGGLLYLEDKKDLRLIVLFLIGLVGNGVMLVSPTWGFRTAFFTYVVLGICAIAVLTRYLKDDKWLDKVIGLIVGLFICFYGIFYININMCQRQLEKDIKRQVKAKADVIYIDAFPGMANCNINPENPYHLEKFKLYYGIDLDKEISLVRDKWKYIIFYKK